MTNLNGVDSLNDDIALEAKQYRVQFTGTGAEYFRIWIVNIFFNLLTLGIYSAWAKVKRMRYIYSNLKLDGVSFEYHGKPWPILKGRILAVFFWFAYAMGFQYSFSGGVVVFVILGLVTPILLWKSLQFKLRNTSYRGVHFNFRGSLGQSYYTFLWVPLITIFSMYLAAPWAHQQVNQFRIKESAYGKTYFSFGASVGQFYKLYGIVLLGLILLPIVVGLMAGLFLPVFAHLMSGFIKIIVFIALLLIFFVLLIVLWQYVFVKLKNLVWNNIMVDNNRFSSDMLFRKMLFIQVTNWLAIVCTLGLFIPFAQMRSLKYQFESTQFHLAGNFDEFCNQSRMQISAVGEGMTDIFDLDMGL